VLLSLLGVYLLSTQPPGAADDDSASDTEGDDAAYAALETPPGSPQPAFA